MSAFTLDISLKRTSWNFPNYFEDYSCGLRIPLNIISRNHTETRLGKDPFRWKFLKLGTFEIHMEIPLKITLEKPIEIGNTTLLEII